MTYWQKERVLEAVGRAIGWMIVGAILFGVATLVVLAWRGFMRAIGG